MTSVPHSAAPGQGLPQVTAAMEAVLTTHADHLARSTGFIQRQGALYGHDFARLWVLGWLQNPQASLDELAQFARRLGISITSQGIHDRWSPQAANFLKALFEVALAQVVVADPVASPLLSRFGAVVLEDSTQIRLVPQLLSLFEASGNRADQEAQSGCKLQVRLDMLRGQLQCSPLLDGSRADANTPLAALPQVPHTLNIRDRGFFDLNRIQREHDQGHYSLTYYKSGVLLFDEHGQPLDLLQWLAERKHLNPSESLQLAVLVGKQQVPMRLLLCPLPQEQADERRKGLQRSAQKHSRAVNHGSFLLAGYDVVLTDVPAELLSLPEALVLVRLRWQIEVLFKLWKQDGLLDEWRTKNPWRVLCELYAKLIGLLIQHWLLIVSCWLQPHRSLAKAAKAVRQHAILLAYAYAGLLASPWVLEVIQQAIQSASPLNRRQKHPSTSQQVGMWSPLPQDEQQKEVA